MTVGWKGGNRGQGCKKRHPLGSVIDCKRKRDFGIINQHREYWRRSWFQPEREGGLLVRLNAWANLNKQSTGTTGFRHNRHNRPEGTARLENTDLGKPCTVVMKDEGLGEVAYPGISFCNYMYNFRSTCRYVFFLVGGVGTQFSDSQ